MRVPRIKAFLVVLAVCAAAAMGATSTAFATVTVGHVYPALDSASASANFSQTASHGGYVILQSWETQKMHTLKAENPSLKVLVYKNFGFSAKLGPDEHGPPPSGVTYAEAPDSWFLKNPSGQRISSGGYNWLYAMDVGSSEYQKRWTQNVLAELESQGWDGVFMDDVNPTMKYSNDPGEVVKYPNDASYAAAVESALAYVGPQIQAQGKLAIGNLGAWVEYASTCNGWLKYLSGGLDEMFVKWGRGAGEGYRDAGQWNTQVEEAKYAAANGKVFLGFTQGSVGDTQAARYGYASLMLASGGSAAYAFTSNYTNEVWMPEFGYDLGNPTGSDRAESSGIHRRTFENGLVLVNPTGSTRTVSFEGTYSGSGLTNATSAAMQPHTGLVLTGASTAPKKAEPEAPAPIEVVATVETEKAPAEKTPVTEAPAPTVEDKPASTESSGGQTTEKVTLKWSTKRARGVKVSVYRVRRNSRPMGRTNLRRRTDRHLTGKRVRRYRIVGLDRNGNVVAKSRLLRVHLGPGHRGKAQRPARRA